MAPLVQQLGSDVVWDFQLQIVTASNQKPLADNLAKKYHQIVRNVEEINGTLENFNKWMKASSDLASQVCDGIGSIRTFNNLS